MTHYTEYLRLLSQGKAMADKTGWMQGTGDIIRMGTEDVRSGMGDGIRSGAED